MSEGKHWTRHLQTQRMQLSALTPDALEAYLNSIEQLEADLEQRLSRAILTPIVKGAIRMKLDKMAAAPPDEWAWYTYWLATVRAARFGAGLIGFKGPPDSQGTIEIGYGIDPEVSNQGYTTEAAAALIEWAFQTPACLQIVAPETRRDNPASHRVLAKLGMEAYAETESDVSYQLTRRAYLKR